MYKNMEQKKKALIVATVGEFINCFEKDNIDLLKSMGYEVHVATNIHLKCEDNISKLQIIKHHVGFSRNPISIKNIAAFFCMINLIDKERFSLIHCHTPVGGVIARLAALRFRKSGIKIIYTAHGFHFYKGASIENWIIFFPIEWILSFFTDTLITINREDFGRAKKVFYAKNVEYIPGVGIDTFYYEKILEKREKIREKLGIAQNDIMLLSVGELNKNKNHKIIIEVLGKIRRKYPNMSHHLHYFIAGEGILCNELERVANELKINLHMLGFRHDIPNLLKATDIFMLPSKREGLNVSLMEAMASGLPCIVSDIRGNKDLILKSKGGYRFLNSLDLEKMLIELISTPEKRREFGKFNQARIKKFDKSIVKKYMIKIYNAI